MFKKRKRYTDEARFGAPPPVVPAKTYPAPERSPLPAHVGRTSPTLFAGPNHGCGLELEGKMLTWEQALRLREIHSGVAGENVEARAIAAFKAEMGGW